MIAKWIESWKSFPPLHKRRFYQGVGAYAVLVAFSIGWVIAHGGDAQQDWQSRVPMAEVPLRAVYMTPQITDVEDGEIFENVADLPQGAGYISMIMTGVGLSDLDTSRALNDLPPEVAVAISPYSPMLQDVYTRARESGREAMVMLPMEPETFPLDDPGPAALLMRRGDEENLKSLKRMLSSSDGAVAAINYMGSRFLSDQKKLYPVMNALHEKKMFFVETPGVTHSYAGQAAQDAATPYLAVDVRIDEKAQEAAIRQSLLDLEKVARQKGYAIGMAQPYPLSFNLIKAWANTLEARGMRLMPISAMPKIKVQSDTRRAMEAPVETPAPENMQDQAPAEMPAHE